MLDLTSSSQTRLKFFIDIDLLGEVKWLTGRAGKKNRKGDCNKSVKWEIRYTFSGNRVPLLDEFLICNHILELEAEIWRCSGK